MTGFDLDTTRRVHQRVLPIAKLFHKICVENSIPYYMLGGSMLGAVRHKGFIPWDDDMDFGVERQYFKKLENLLRSQLPDNFSLICRKDTPNFFGGYIKIEDNRTLVKENNISYVYGVNIDIFPLDRTNDNFSVFSRNKAIDLLYRIQNYRFYDLSKATGLKRKISKFLHFVGLPHSKDRIFEIIEKYLLKDRGDCLANYFGAWGLKEVVKNDIMGEPVLYSFEDTSFYGVSNYKQYLEQLYGDYNTLPPVEKQSNHIKEIVIKP